MLYFILASGLFLFSIANLKKIKVPYSIVYLSLFSLIIIAGIRIDTGTDYAAYFKLWTQLEPSLVIQKYFHYAELERGFVAFMTFLKQFTHSSVLFFTSCAFLAIVPLFLGIRKLKLPYIFVALLTYCLLFYIPYTLNGMRQAITMAIFIFSVPYILERKTVIVFILTCIAGTFHNSGFLIFVAYLVQFYRGNIFYVALFGFILCLVISQLGILNKIIFDYVGLSRVYLEKFTESTSLLKLLSRMIILLPFLWIYEKASQEYQSIFKMYLIGFFIYFLLLDYNMLATRFNMFFRILEVLLLPMLLMEIKPLKVKLAVFFAFTLLYSYSFYTAVIFKDNVYQTFLFN